MEQNLIKALVLLNIRSKRDKDEVIKPLTEYFGSEQRAEKYYNELWKLVYPYEELCDCGHIKSDHQPKSQCIKCECMLFERN